MPKRMNYKFYYTGELIYCRLRERSVLVESGFINVDPIHFLMSLSPLSPNQFRLAEARLCDFSPATFLRASAGKDPRCDESKC